MCQWCEENLGVFFGFTDTRGEVYNLDRREFVTVFARRPLDDHRDDTGVPCITEAEWPRMRFEFVDDREFHRDPSTAEFLARVSYAGRIRNPARGVFIHGGPVA